MLGVLQFLAHTLRATWMKPLGSVDASRASRSDNFVMHSESPVLSPVWMASKTASSLLAALESSMPAFAWEEIEGLAERIGLVVLSLSGDMDGSNVRVKHFLATRAAELNSSSRRGAILILEIAAHTSYTD